MKILILSIGLLFFSPLYAKTKVETKDFNYKVGKEKHIGYLAWNSQSKGKSPGILLVPEWWGLNEDIKNKAKRLAEMGYVVLAIDLYGNGITTKDPEQAGKWLAQLQAKDTKASTEAFMAGLFELKKNKKVLPQKVAVVGYSFGGALATEMARRGHELKAVVNFHGAVRTDKKARPGFVKAPILWLKGEHDSFIDKKMEEDFRKEMKDAKAKLKVVTYKNTFHSFTYPEATEIGKKHNFFISYNPVSDKESWEQMRVFLKTHLR